MPRYYETGLHFWGKTVSETARPTYGHLFEVDHDAALREKFSSGQGVAQLQPDMNGAMLLAVIKTAIAASNGKPFVEMSAAA